MKYIDARLALLTQVEGEQEQERMATEGKLHGEKVDVVCCVCVVLCAGRCMSNIY